MHAEHQAEWTGQAVKLCLLLQMAQISDFDPRLADLEARFASLRNEYGMLYCLVCCANARLIGPWRQDWEPPYELKYQMLQIVVRFCIQHIDLH